jgi:hypothetical protein
MARQITEVFDGLMALDDPNPSRTLLVKLQAQVKREIPTEALWMPPLTQEPNGGLTKLQSAISPEVPVHLPCLDGVA